jgi:D-glycero-alpha-D-manno-heptose-7-phosphate kinase
MLITSRAPVRVDFAGGWTDVGLFAQGAGGAVVNATINHYVEGHLEAEESDYPLLMTTPAAPGIVRAGGEGLRVEYHSDLPSGSGLGTSAALNVVWLSLLKSRVESDEDRARLAELAYQLEALLGILGGRQDQYASAFGGFNHMRFGPVNEEVQVERLNVPPDMVQELESRLVLCYTGKQRLSGNIHENVWGQFRRGAAPTVNALYALRDCAHQMRHALLEGNADAFAELLSENWRHQCALDPSITNSQIETLFEEAKGAGAVGGKACGAGGGGCLLFCAAPNRQPYVSDALAQAGARIIPFQFDTTGVQVTHEA